MTDMDTTNAAIMFPDVLHNSSLLIQPNCKVSPAEFHALNSLVEAVVLHERVYFYNTPSTLEGRDDGLYGQLIKEQIIQPVDTLRVFEHEVRERGMNDTAESIFLDQTWGNHVLSYSPGTLTRVLRDLIEFENNLGIERMSSMQAQGPGGEQFAALFARNIGFTRDDMILIDDTYRKLRAFSVAASELGLEMYTGLVSRPFIISDLNTKKRIGLKLFELLKAELDDIDDTDIPQWRRFDIPIMTQIVLENCHASTNAFQNELLTLRQRLSRFRLALTEYAHELMMANTRGEKRKIRKVYEASFQSLLDKEDKTTRLHYQAWTILNKPTEWLKTIGDHVLDEFDRERAINRVCGLTDLWRELSDAPTVERNTALVKDTFGAEIDSKEWFEVQQLASRLEQLMQHNEKPGA